MTRPCPKCGTIADPLIIQHLDGSTSVNCKGCSNRVVFIKPNADDIKWATELMEAHKQEVEKCQP